uniref:Nucleotide-diphospho-sugar transferase domain-containing protein n=1 Tax=Proboscia inermis TaxID=420281 RepID=A0A7S0CFX8_9STRA|mmetsp:Transcript_4572/g.4732  ORF Transcript_4572/g.4732 Transcript_4572/m.4732 type:complete len:407 (+) Transcript_4572:362-1582(+)
MPPPSFQKLRCPGHSVKAFLAAVAIFTCINICRLAMLMDTGGSELFTIADAALPSTRLVNISIVQISDDSSRKKLAPNLENLNCYARLQGYQIILANIDKDCRQKTKDIHFLRQCTVHRLMMNAKNQGSTLPSVTRDHWFLVLDGDIAVINPNHRIEEYIEASRNRYEGDVIHGLRFHNNEVTACIYLVKNSQFGREYVRSWSDLYPEQYHHQLGNSDIKMHYGGANSDNGALYWHLLQYLTDADVPGQQECLQAGQNANKSETHATYIAFVTCFHKVAKQTRCRGREWDRIDILPRRRNIAVDGWPFGWQFSDHSFMQHTIKSPPMRIPAAHSIYRPTAVRGRWPPPIFSCSLSSHDPLAYRMDEFYVNETYFAAMEEWADTMQRKKRNNNPLSWDDNSCIQSGR